MKKILPWLLAASFFVAELLTLGDYGMNWDEPVRLLRGQAFVEYFLTGNSIRLPKRLSPILYGPGQYVTRYDIAAGEGATLATLPDNPRPQTEFTDMGKTLGRRVSFYQDSTWSDYFLTYSQFEAGHLPLPEILGSVSNRLFYQAAGVLGDIESYHVPYIVISALGVGIAAAFTLDITGSFLAALVAGLSIGLFPLFFAEAHFNMKDPLVAAFFAGTIWSFWHWVKSNSIRWGVLFAIFIALSLAVKWNIVFLPFIIVPWLISIRKTPEFRRWFNLKKLIVYSGVTGLSCIVFMLAIWPVSWSHPFTALFDLVKYYMMIGSGGDFIQPRGFVLPLGINIYPLTLLLAQTPIIILVLTLAGIFAPGEMRILLLLWLLVPVIRYSLPYAHAYSGWRQIMEVVPAMAVLSGVGADYLLRIARKKMQKVVLLCIFISFIILILTLIRLHPNENAYFNSFVGGLSRADAKNLIDPFITNGNIYKQGAEWFNAHAEKDARIAILDGRTFALSPLYLRRDISISPFYFSGFDRKGEYIFVTKVNSQNPMINFSYGYVTGFLTPVYELKVNGVPLLSIYKNDPAYLISGMGSDNPIQFTKEWISTPNAKYLSLDFRNNVRVTRIIVSGFSASCTFNEPFTSYEEVIRFLPSPVPADFNPTDHTYALIEKKYDGGGVVEYVFPAVPARHARIYVNSKASCFNGGIISAVYGL